MAEAVAQHASHAGVRSDRQGKRAGHRHTRAWLLGARQHRAVASGHTGSSRSRDALVCAADRCAFTISYDAPITDHGIQRIYVRRSGDGGLTWSNRLALSVDGEHATAPMMESIGDGEVRLAYYQTARGGDLDRWNVWFRSSSDGGRTWTSPVKISDAYGGVSYKRASGFGEVYGDYAEMAITSVGKTIGAWGEGPSYIGPGGVWINRQT